MKKLFTLFAFLAVFMGAKADWVEDYSIDYSTKTSFPFYVMGYVPEWVDGVMTDYGADYRYATQADLDGDGDGKWKDGESSVGSVILGETEYQKVTGAGPYWHQYFVADGVTTELDGSYKVTAMIKASEEINLELQMGWGQWWTGTCVTATAKVGTEWAEVEWEFSGIGGTSCNLDAKPGSSTATIEWKWLKVEHNAKAERPTTWQQWLTNDGQPIIPGVETESKYMGDAETAWPAWSLETDGGINANWRGDRTGEICAWALTMGKNFDDQNTVIKEDSPRARPYPADIEEEEGNASNHVFAVHVDQIAVIDAPTEDANSIQWSNQFWIQSPQGWKEGTQVKIKFRYKAKIAAKAATQIHKKNPSDYLHWQAAGDVNFTTEWQDFEKTITFDGSQAGGWSLAFNLCAESTKDAPQPANVFYFDDLSWETMKLDEGYFVAASNPGSGLDYDFDNAIEFTQDPTDNEVLIATVGEVGKKETWVKELMISTTRGNTAAFKGATLKPSGTIVSDPDTWLNYEAGSLAKISLPAAGVWVVRLAPDTDDNGTVLGTGQISFEQLEGEAPKEPVDIVTNATEIVIKGKEREDLKDNKNNDGTITVREEADDPNGIEVGGAGHEGQTWDNQFFIVANRIIEGGTETVIEFDYVATAAFNSGTGTHAKPGDYRKNAVRDVDFTTEVQHFKEDYTIPAKDWGNNDITDAQSIAFDLAVLKEANTYTIKNVRWYLKSDTEGKTMENLINAEGTDNFWVAIKKVNNDKPYQYVSNQIDKKFDLIEDGAVDIADLQKEINIIVGTDIVAAGVGDFNGDNVVDIADLQLLINEIVK